MGYGSLPRNDGNETTDPNDVAQATESGIVLDDVPAGLLREVAAIRLLMACDPEGDLISIDYSARLRMFALADDREDTTA